MAFNDLNPLDNLSALMSGANVGQPPPAGLPTTNLFGQDTNVPYPLPDVAGQLPNDARLTVDNPHDPQVKKGLKQDWMGWLQNLQQNPKAQLSLLKVGLAMMQPIQPGQTTGGHIAQALNVGVDTLEKLKQQDIQNEYLKARTESTKESTKQAGKQTEIAQQRLDLYAKQLGLQESEIKALEDPNSFESKKRDEILRGLKLRNDRTAEELKQLKNPQDILNMPEADLKRLAIATRVKELTDSGRSLFDAVRQAEQDMKGSSVADLHKLLFNAQIELQKSGMLPGMETPDTAQTYLDTGKQAEAIAQGKAPPPGGDKVRARQVDLEKFKAAYGEPKVGQTVKTDNGDMKVISVVGNKVYLGAPDGGQRTEN